MKKEELDAYRLALSMALLRHVGPDKKIGMGELYEHVFKTPWTHRINDTRNLRLLITDLRKEGMPICSNGQGYWIAASASEINAFCERSKQRALSILSRISMMKNVSLPDYLGQMQLELGARHDA